MTKYYVETVGKGISFLHSVNREKINWLVTSCVGTAFSKTLFQETLGRLEVAGRRVRRHRQLPNDIKGKGMLQIERRSNRSHSVGNKTCMRVCTYSKTDCGMNARMNE